jgi:MoaA/NifB/PqqE/SkfB family radical SAM enzyme
VSYDELPAKRWASLVKEAGKMGVREVRIPGSGEPLIRRDVVLQIVNLAFIHGMSSLIITNGTLFDELSIRQMVGKADNVTFSIDGPNPQINDWLRGMEGAFERSTWTIRRFVYWKRRLNKAKPLLRINVVISNRNFNRLADMIELAHQLGCAAVSFQPMTVFSEWGERLRLTEAQTRALASEIERARSLAQDLNIFTNLNQFMPVEVKKSNQMDELIEAEIKNVTHPFLSLPCFEPWYNLIIMPSGIAGPCSVFGGQDGVSVASQGLEEVWYGGWFEQVRRTLLRKELFAWCKNCCVPVFEENRALRGRLAQLLVGTHG